jgi:glycosyltransferase involved in cell wall biosynthesis
MNICIVIPVYNSPYIYEVVQDLMKYDYKIIVVDDGSSKNIDLKDLDIEVITHKQNMGKGQAILTGAKRAKELGYDCFLTMDADKQHLSSQIKVLIDAYKPNSIVIGNRDFDDKNVPNSSKFGRRFSNFWVYVETFKKLGDTQSGFRIYPISILDLNVKNKRFDFEIEILVLHSYKKGEIIDVDVLCYYPPFDQRVSHFDKVKDNIRLSLLHSRLVMQRFFLLRGFLWN